MTNTSFTPPATTNVEQWISIVDKTITGLGFVAVSFGFADSAAVGSLVAALIGLVGAAGIAYGAIRSFTKNTHFATIEKAKVSIAAAPAEAGPVIQALRLQGATVSTSGTDLGTPVPVGKALYDLGLIVLLVVVAIAGAGAAFGPKLAAKLPITRESILQGERVYALVLVGVKNYEKACKDRAIPATCDSTVTIIKADVIQTNTIYQVVKGYEDMPPADVGHAFLAAIAVLKVALPAAYHPQGA